MSGPVHLVLDGLEKELGHLDGRVVVDAGGVNAVPGSPYRGFFAPSPKNCVLGLKNGVSSSPSIARYRRFSCQLFPYGLLSKAVVATEGRFGD